jgi:hypothetical protein
MISHRGDQENDVDCNEPENQYESDGLNSFDHTVSLFNKSSDT